MELKDSYAVIDNGEAYPVVPTSPVRLHTRGGHDPERRRKLLMHKSEISRLAASWPRKG